MLPGELHEAAPIGWGELAAVHDRGLGLPWSPELVVDCDVHQGDGTADIFAADARTFTLSLHGARNYPFSRVASDLDVDIASGAGDREYLRALEDALGQALERARPDFYLAGADPWSGDRLGRLALCKPAWWRATRWRWTAC